jgi:hypothetical protein
MLAYFFKSLYIVRLQLAVQKHLIGCLSYHIKRYLIAKHHRYSHLFYLALVLLSLANYLVLVMLAYFFNSLYSVGIQLEPSKTFDWMSILPYFKAPNS